MSSCMQKAVLKHDKAPPLRYVGKLHRVTWRILNYTVDIIR